ncbi:MAG TPA: glycogen-binding domain-containing protein [Candidatus Limnocylindrales bacterium]|jgi:1,4-alpha-glucan branching enzyme|nr:glycogen-binding domain-containing protein [Candidatus Limnocylindrales bacterium]
MARKVETSRKQTFRFAAPGALSVLLAGDFTHWQQAPIPMQKGKDGLWSASVELPPGKHNYRFIVDGEWCDDPECTLRVPNPYGGENMVRQVA